MYKYLMAFLLVLVNYLFAQEKVFINDVPDYSQPPDSSIKFTRDRSNYCAPIAFANIVSYWDSVQNHPYARKVMGSLPGKVVAEYIGWFMDTNDQGNPGRDNGTGRPSANGTYGHDQWMGAQEYINFDSVNNFLYPDSIPKNKVGYGWDLQLVPVADFMPLKEELDKHSPVKADFKYWNIIPTGLYLTDALFIDDTVYIYDWGLMVGNSGSIDERDPQETWNLSEEPEGNIGHAVTVVGYLENYKADTSYAIVHDNWSNTPKNIAIPWLQNKVSSWMFAHLPELPDLTISRIDTRVDTTKGYTDSLWIDLPVTVDLKIQNLGKGGAGSYIVEIRADDPIGNRLEFETRHITEILDAYGFGMDSIEVSFDSLFTPSQSGMFTISSVIYWDLDKDGIINDPADDDVSNDTLSVKVNVYMEPTSLNDQRASLKDFYLFQNHPNPFNPSTVISWQLPVGSQIELNIYNISGEKVVTLVSEKKVAGHHSIEWDAAEFASGVYFYTLRTDAGFVQTRKLLLLK
jgi:hypothetical protein